MDYLSSLNPAQLEAVTTTEGFVRVIAGAGSGKTKALTSRFAYLVNDMGILPGSILCVTFTNKAANEMRQRIHALTGDNDTGYISTFHGFCVSILQEDSHAVQYPKSFLVLDNSDIDSMLKVIYEERNLTLRDHTFAAARDMIEMQKLQKKPEYYLDMITMSVDTLKEKYLTAEETDDIIFYGYLYQEKKCFGLDYNDLIKFSLYIFKENPDIRLKWQQRLEYIMIDEFQDIDQLQYDLMEVLCGWHKNLFIVGDPDQTIYSWRGASVSFLLDFADNHPGTRTIMMNDNYRSTPEILAAVNSLIRKNQQRMEKDLIPMKPSGEKVTCRFTDNAEKEAEWIADRIEELTGLHFEQNTVQNTAQDISGNAVGNSSQSETQDISGSSVFESSPNAPQDAVVNPSPTAEASSNSVSPALELKDITLLYRAHYVTRPVEEVFQRRKIPYTIYSGVPFFGRMEIKDALSYLRMIALKDDLSFTRIVNVPRRNMGERRMAFLKEEAGRTGCSLYDTLKQNLDNEIFKGTKAARFVELIERFSENYADRSVSEVLTELLDKSGYETLLRTEGSQERLDNLAELKQSIYEYESSCGEEAGLEDYLRHVALYTNSDTTMSGSKVRLMTIHAAKGLEFPCVFLLGLNEGIFPSKKSTTREGMEEERRLAFVAMTRAEDRLYLTCGGGRNFDSSPRYPSRFLLDIDPQLLYFPEEPPRALIEDARQYIDSSSRYMPENLTTLMLPEGTRVRHSIMGDGTIVGFDLAKKAHIVQFDDLSTPRMISVRAKLDVLKQ